MSAAKENPCRKFQANFFNKSKCQNCFKPRELHLLTDQDLTQAKPIYGGWLCLAPEGTDFENPTQRSRKWQRRFFVLYEHGCLRFALDESPSTLPQGTVNMNLCTDVIDSEPKTGQKNSLCIITPDQEYFIRGENKEIINGWSEQLVVYPQTNKQNQKKKRKVEPTTSQEPGPAKVAVTGSGIPEAEKVPNSSSLIWQEELNQREAEGAPVWAPDLPPGSPLPPAVDPAAHGSDSGSLNGDEVDQGGLALAGSAPQPPRDPVSPTGSCSSSGGVPHCLSPAPSDPFPSGGSLLSNGSHISGSVSSLDSDASGSTVTSTDSHPANQRGGHCYSHHDHPRSRRLEAEARKAEKRSRFRSPDRPEMKVVQSPESRSGVIEKLEALELENPEKMEVEELSRRGGRQGRSEHRGFHREDVGLDFASSLPPLRRAKSLDRRTTESVMTPDLLNFKKGWMVRLDAHGQWKKYWFVLTDHSLRYYRDSIAEEASDLDGEIDLSTCYSVTEYQAQRNYGFQIHTREGVHTLSAMTAGIRRNWIQAVMKNVRPSAAPDVASSTEAGGSSGLPEAAGPDVTRDSICSEALPAGRESTPAVAKSRARERRREGRSKTFDWAQFRPIAQALAQQRAEEAGGLRADLDHLERSVRREDRWRRRESVSGSSSEQTSAHQGGRKDCEGGDAAQQSASPVGGKQRVEEEIEQHWQQLEKTPIREERRVPLQSRDTAELQQLLENHKQGIEDLKAQLERCHQQLVDSNRHKQELELQLRTSPDVRTGYISPLERPLGLEADVTPQTKRPELVSSQAQSLTRKYQETKELLKLHELKKRNMQAQLGPALSHPPMKEPYLSEPPTAAPALGGPPHEVVQKTTSFPSEDSIGAIQEPDSSSAGKPLSLLELEQLSGCRRCNEETAETHQLLKLLESWKYQRDKRSLAVAGGSIQQYQTCFFTLEDFFSKVENPRFRSPCSPLLGTDDHSEADQVTHGMLSQRIDLWTIENGALKQRRQQIINQLIAADREIDKLEAELIGQQGGRQHHTGREELKGELAGKQAYEIDRGYNERELSENALTTLEKLGDTENQPQSNGADYGEEEPNKALLQVANAMVVWMKADPQSAEQRILKLEARNGELMTLNLECETVRRMELREAESKIRMLKEKAEEVERTLSQCVEADDGGLMKQPVTEVERKSGAINQVLQMLAKVAVTVDELLWDLEGTLLGYSKEEPLHVELGMGAGFWNQLLFSSEIQSEEKTDGCAAGLAQQMRAQTRLMLLTRRTSPPAEAEIERVTEQDVAAMYRWLEQETRAFILREKTDTLAAKSNVSTQAASNVKLAKDEQVVSLALTSFASDDEKKLTSQHLWTEAQMSYVISRLEVQQEKELDEKQAELQISRLDCTYCHELWKATKDLQSKLADLQIQPSVASLKSAAGHKASVRGGKPIDAPNRSNELDDAIARHSEELEDVTDSYEQEADTLTLRVPSEENVKEIKSLANGVENIKKRTTPMETFVEEMEELRSTTKPTTPDVNSTDEDPPAQTSPPEEAVRVPADVTQEMRRDITALRLKYQKDLENLKATCERGFTAMEVSHQKVIDELQRKHQRELENLHEEKERLLAEETAATIAAIEAMKNAHRAELEKELDKARKANNNTENADIEEIRRQHEEELCSFQREIEVLSDQYSQKCLENAHLAQALEAERQALRQCQRENQELNAHNQELNNRLAAEITKMRSMASEDGGGDTHTTIQGKELYELEVMLRVKESEVQYLKQEINSLKEELQAAQRDKKYATDKYKDIYTELSIVKAKAERDLGRLRDQLQAAHEALGEASLEEVERGGYDIMKSKSNPDILKMAAAAAKRSERTMRSKSLKEGLTAEQRLHLFENEDAKEF
ncbi:myosin phosphatase Rho-interacting protein isoform X1 [Gasterosteus aculeatus]